ncbi:MAG: hydroxyacid dehydrogenase [Anaerolineae bacterium]
MLPKVGKVLVADPISEEGQIILRMWTELTVEVELTPEQLEEIIGEYDALIVRSRTRVTAQIITAGRRLRVIGRAGVGTDNIDMAAARERNITVINTPIASSVAVAELTLGLMIALARHIPQANTSVKEGHWTPKQYRGVELAGKTLGIIGLGRIGREVASRAIAFGLHLIAYDPFVTILPPELYSIKLANLNELLAQSDFVSIHVPLLPNTKGMINRQAFSLMKRTAYLICCARGGIVNEGDLLEALQTHRLAGVALDVFELEPPGQHPLLSHNRVICTPHLGALTQEAQTKAAVDVAWGVIDVLQGQKPYYEVVTAKPVAAISG